MYSMLIRLMLLAALTQLGIQLSDFRDCKGRECFIRMEAAALQVLDISWKPISVWPEEAKRFR